MERGLHCECGRSVSSFIAVFYGVEVNGEKRGRPIHAELCLPFNFVEGICELVMF